MSICHIKKFLIKFLLEFLVLEQGVTYVIEIRDPLGSSLLLVNWIVHMHLGLMKTCRSLTYKYYIIQLRSIHLSNQCLVLTRHQSFVLDRYMYLSCARWGRRLHSVPSYKERCKILTSMFFKFPQIFYSFCSLFFKLWTIVVKRMNYLMKSLRPDPGDIWIGYNGV